MALIFRRVKESAKIHKRFLIGGNRMKERFDLFLELREAFSNGVWCVILWGMVLTCSALVASGLYFKCYILYSTAIELSVYILLLAVIATISWIHVQIKTRHYLKSLTTDEKDLLLYIYDRSEKITNAVYIPYDNAVAIDLKYKRILRRYGTSIKVEVERTKNVSTETEKIEKNCFLYGIRKLPEKFIKKGNLQSTNRSSETIRNNFEIFQSISINTHS